VAAARLARCREAVNRLAVGYGLPPENLLAPDAVRRLAWSPPEPADPDAVAAALKEYGARPWQIELTTHDLVAALPS
jgi:ribonuclease D